MERDIDKDLALEIDGGRIHIRMLGYRTPRSMAFDDCAGVSLRMAPSAGVLAMTLRYRVELMGRGGESGILIGDTSSLAEAAGLWRRAAAALGKPALAATPDEDEADTPPSYPPPIGIAMTDEGGRIRLLIRRSKMEHFLAGVLAIGLFIALTFGERKPDDALFMVVAAGLLAYAVIAGLSARFIEIADGILTAGLRTPLGEFAKVQMPLREIDAVLWGKTGKGWGRIRSAFAMATAERAKSFDRLPEDQARWLTRLVRKRVRD